MLRPGKEPDAEPGDNPEALTLFRIEVSNQLINKHSRTRGKRIVGQNGSVINQV